jgi:hypothetical protein
MPLQVDVEQILEHPARVRARLDHREVHAVLVERAQRVIEFAWTIA